MKLRLQLEEELSKIKPSYFFFSAILFFFSAVDVPELVAARISCSNYFLLL